MPKQIKIVLVAAIVILIGWFIWDAFSQPGVQDLRGGFEEVAVYRNENNTGPVIRVYAVAVTDTVDAEMEAYGNYMPHTKYGNTKVYFFPKGKPMPKELFPGEENFPAEYQPNVLAKYEKNAMGKVTFQRY